MRRWSKWPRAEGQAVLIEVFTDFDFDDVGGVVSGAVLEVLKDAAYTDEDGDTDHGESKGGILGFAAEDPGDDDGEDGQSCDPGPDRDEAKDCGKEDAEPHALRELEQSDVEVHKAAVGEEGPRGMGRLSGPSGGGLYKGGGVLGNRGYSVLAALKARCTTEMYLYS